MFISNTSTLVLLAKVGCLERFLAVSPIIEIPVQVKSEALFDIDSYYARLIQKLIQEKKINVIPVDSTKVKNIMSQFRLDYGEAAAYAGFNSSKHQAILTDDGELIKLCKLEKAPFICALAVIIRLYEKKQLSKNEARDKLNELQKIGRYSEKIMEYFKDKVK